MRADIDADLQGARSDERMNDISERFIIDF